MADALLSIPLEIALGKLAQYVEQQIGLYAGASRELKKIQNMYESIKAVLEETERKQFTEKRVRLWLSKLKMAAYDIEDAVDEWQISGLTNNGSKDSVNDDDKEEEEDKVCGCFPSPFACFNRSASRYKVARQMEEIRERLNEIAEDKNQFNFISGTDSSSCGKMNQSRRPQTTSLVDESQVIGRDDDKRTVISRLVGGNSSGDADGRNVQVTAIVGVGGLGKTTLAQQICNDGKMKDHFSQGLYWVCVSDGFDVLTLTKVILEKVKKTSISSSDLDLLQNELLESVRGKRFLLVLDDVWNDDADEWEMLRLSLGSGAQGSKILVTTRSWNVAKIMNSAYTHRLQGLSDDLSWTLFSRRAFAGRRPEECSEFECLGKEIVNKCSGVPLLLKVMGNVMNSKRTKEDWKNILDSEIWSLRETQNKILPALLLSYYNLPPHLKQCFTYCSVYQKDTEMKKDELVKLWVAQGFIQEEGNREIEDIAKSILMI